MNDRYRILYVDDEEINLDNFVTLFEDDFEVVTAASGEEAMRFFVAGEAEVSVVVSDQRMGGMSGVELLSRIYECDPDPARIILTAYADFRDLTEAVNKGHIYQYVQKPWEYRSLKTILLRGAEACEMSREKRRLLKELSRRNVELHTANELLEIELHKNKVAEEKRRQAEILMLSQAKLASLGEMATGIAHEINQPLSFIRIMLQAVKRDVADGSFVMEEFLGDVDEALGQIGRISTIIDHMRTFGRAEVMERTAVDLPEVVRRALIPLRQRLHLDNIDLHVEAASGLPQVYGVPVQLEQVFINLLSNAMDALTGVEKKEIRIGLEAADGEVRARVADNGCGMTSEVRERIFEPFFTTKEVGRGTGVGLAISYGILREHGGAIACDSAPGKGAVFTVTLPAAGNG